MASAWVQVLNRTLWKVQHVTAAGFYIKLMLSVFKIQSLSRHLNQTFQTVHDFITTKLLINL